MAFAISMVLGQGLLACGTTELKAEGEPCFASSECDVGLTCDFGSNPAVCRTQQTDPGGNTPRPDAGGISPDGGPGSPDAAPGAPDAAPTPPDAAPAPDAAPLPPDAAPTPPDAAPLPPDAA